MAQRQSNLIYRVGVQPARRPGRKSEEKRTRGVYFISSRILEALSVSTDIDYKTVLVFSDSCAWSDSFPNVQARKEDYTAQPRSANWKVMGPHQQAGRRGRGRRGRRCRRGRGGRKSSPSAATRRSAAAAAARVGAGAAGRRRGRRTQTAGAESGPMPAQPPAAPALPPCPGTIQESSVMLFFDQRLHIVLLATITVI